MRLQRFSGYQNSFLPEIPGHPHPILQLRNRQLLHSHPAGVGGDEMFYSWG